MTDPDIATLLRFYRGGHAEGGFERGIQEALTRLLISPEFLFRIERDPAHLAADGVYAISDMELASRLSFFLWSSIPDDELLDAAARGELRDPDALEAQVRRMLSDPRAAALTRNFGGQWLLVRNLQAVDPDVRARIPSSTTTCASSSSARRSCFSRARCATTGRSRSC